jgi:hypothetical protein
MTHPYGTYLANIFIRPARAARDLTEEENLLKVSLISYAIGVGAYIIIVLLGYHALGWDAFPFRRYYPHYLSPYWWEIFVVPVWGGMLAFAYGAPSYLLGRLFGGKGSFGQVMSVVLLATIVSLPLQLVMDGIGVLSDSDAILRFAVYGNNYRGSEQFATGFGWVISNFYIYIAMTWQMVVTVVGLTVIHRTPWYTHIPAMLGGTGIFFGFLLLIRDYVALII